MDSTTFGDLMGQVVETTLFVFIFELFTGGNHTAITLALRHLGLTTITIHKHEYQKDSFINIYSL